MQALICRDNDVWRVQQLEITAAPLEQVPFSWYQAGSMCDIMLTRAMTGRHAWQWPCRSTGPRRAKMKALWRRRWAIFSVAFDRPLTHPFAVLAKKHSLRCRHHPAEASAGALSAAGPLSGAGAQFGGVQRPFVSPSHRMTTKTTTR